MRWWLVLGVMVGMTSVLAADTAAVISLRDATTLLAPGTRTKCTTTECLIEDAYAADSKAQELALALFRDTGTIAGVGPEEVMDGGYRGKIRLVPQLPLGVYRKHLTWTDGALRSIDAFFAELFANQTTAPNYRWRALSLRFVRSINKRTPSAYAFGWTIEHNVEGSLLTSAPGTRAVCRRSTSPIRRGRRGSRSSGRSPWGLSRSRIRASAAMGWKCGATR